MPETHGFELIEEREIAELNSKAWLYRHIKTGAELLSVTNDDENKVFGTAFRTPPEDSTGVAHILEHSVLAGSEKYPVKEPFLELVKGSLATFVNAFTYPDKTIYPVASKNEKDFRNLIDVYLDAIFHPLLPRHVLDQEGWHYELEDLDAPLIYKGVVFNEMKGAMSDANNALFFNVVNSLFPDNTYGHNSGGKPKDIPNLTYEQFKEFWEKYYHPSNAKFYWYGDDDPQARLEFLGSYLQGYERQAIDSQIPVHAEIDEPNQVVRAYAAGDAEAKNYISVNWVLPENNHPETSLALSILSHILVGSQASPLRKALIDSGFGEDTVGGGLEDELRQLVFMTGLKGVNDENVANVEPLIFETLQDLADKGIDPDTIAASMNTVEFALRENKHGGLPQGLSILMRALATWLHDGSPFTLMAFEEPLQAIKTNLESNPDYFEDLIRTHFLENDYRTTVVMEPDTELNQKDAAAEEAKLTEVRGNMSQEELQSVLENTQKLQEIQQTPNSPEALATLPVLKLSDLDKTNTPIPMEISEDKGVPVYYHDLFTNGILYLDIGFDLHSISQDLIPYLDLFAGGLVRMGTESEDFVRLTQRIGRDTGGIGPSLNTDAIYGSKESSAWMLLRAKTTVDKADKLLDILRDVILTVNFDDQERFTQILMENKSRYESGLVSGGHIVVNTRLKSAQSEAGWLTEQTRGVDQLNFLRKLSEDVQNDWGSVLDNLNSIQQTLLNRGAMFCNVTVDSQSWSQIQPSLSGFIESVPEIDFERKTWQPKISHKHEGLSIPSPVNFVGKGINIFDFGHQYSGSVAVVGRYLRATHLWDKIRAEGGAYGALMVIDPASGSLNFLSYRDPNLIETLDNYDGSADFLRNLDISQEELTKAIIGGISDLDGHQLPDEKGYTSLMRHLIGYSDEDRQLIRDQILAATPQDFKAMGAWLEDVSKNGRVVVLGSEETLQKANQEKEDWLDIKKLL